MNVKRRTYCIYGSEEETVEYTLSSWKGSCQEKHCTWELKEHCNALDILARFQVRRVRKTTSEGVSWNWIDVEKTVLSFKSKNARHCVWSDRSQSSHYSKRKVI
jgi:hypothetical protein